MIKIISWNVNSVRTRLAAIKEVLEEMRPDIVCLQETKVIDELFPHDFFNEFGYKYRFILGQPSYNGVAILSKLPCEKIENINIQNAARHLAVRIAGMDLHNFYVPAGGDIPDVNINPKFADKLQFVEHMTQWLGARYQSSDKVILLGDLNIAPLENDVWSHKQLLQVVSHTPIEVKKYNELQKSLAFIDAHRYFVPESEKLYSWWSYRNRDWRKSNRGRRLDHILVTPALEQQIKAADIYISARDITKPSDHVPVSVDIG